MNNGNFSQFGVQERQYSDVESVQSPVQDNSKAVKAAGLAEGVTGLASLASSGYSIYKDIKQADALEANMILKKEFERSLLKAKSLADKHGSKSIMFNTYLTQAFTDSDLDLDTKTKMMKDFQATALGKSFTELTPEQEGFEAVTKEAVKSGFIVEGMTEEQAAIGLSEYQAMLASNRMAEEQLKQLQLKRATVGLTSEELSLVDKQIGQKNFEVLSNLAANYRSPIKNKITDLANRYNSGELDRKSVEEMAKAQRGDLLATVGQLSRGMDKTSVDALAQPMIELYDNFIANLDSVNLLKEIENSNKLMIAKVQRNQLLNNPDLVYGVSLSSLVQHNDPSLIAKVGNVTARMLDANSQKGTQNPANIADGSEDTKVYLDVVADSIGKLDMVGKDGMPLIDKRELSTNIENIFTGGAKFMDSNDPPARNKQLIKWLAQPTVGDYVRENLRDISPKGRTALSNTIIENAKNYVYPKVQQLVASEFKGADSKIRGGTSENDVDLVQRNGQLIFTAKTSDPYTKSIANKMNREAGAALNDYFNAFSNITGETVESLFEMEKSAIWPSKFAEEDTTSKEQPVTTVDYSQYEGKVIEDEKTGIRYAVRNGIPVEIGGGPNGGK